MQDKFWDRYGQVSIFVIISLIWMIIGWVLHSLLFPNQPTLAEEIQEVIQRDYPGEMPTDEELALGAAQGMIELLDDPFADVIPPPGSMRFDADFAGNSGVIGLVPNSNEEGQLFVETILEGGTAEAAGVQVGDILLSIDGISIDSTTTALGSTILLRGPIGEPAELVIQRDGKQLTFMPLRQERIALEWDILEGGIGYIAQYTFTTNVPQQFEEAVANIMSTEPSAIIWDVRFNGGGSMHVAQEVLSYFVADGPLFQVRLKEDDAELFSATGKAIAPDVPIYVLVNEFSFSAAETVAASIQELGRGVTVGRTTFGKGSVQNTIPLRGDYLFEYTIGYWETPAGVSYEGVGFTPQIEAIDNPETAVDETIEAALKLIGTEN